MSCRNNTSNRIRKRVSSFISLILNLKRFLAGEVAISWSQTGEDVLLQAFLRNRIDDASYNGFWVDIGAHHPVKWSNTKTFSDRGWRGINVDASVNAIEILNKKRARDINVNVGIGPVSGVLDYYKMSMPAMNTFSKEFAEKAEIRGGRIVDVVKVPVITLRELLDRYLPSGQHIDFLSIDCEGLDLSILQSSDWYRYRPDYILVEIHTEGRNWDIPNCSVSRYMREQGYEFVGQSYVTTLYKCVSTMPVSDR